MQPTISKEANHLQERPQKQVIQKSDESSNYSSSPVSGRASRGLDLVTAEVTMLSEKYRESKRRGNPTKKQIRSVGDAEKMQGRSNGRANANL